MLRKTKSVSIGCPKELLQGTALNFTHHACYARYARARTPLLRQSVERDWIHGLRIICIRIKLDEAGLITAAILQIEQRVLKIANDVLLLLGAEVKPIFSGIRRLNTAAKAI